MINQNPSKQLSIYFYFVFLSLIVLTITAPVQDRVTMQLHVNYTHTWYSGYLNFSMSKYHYVFFQSQHDWDNDPVVLWLNGGPGCSSLIGMVTQNGPFVFQANTTMLKLNPHSWNKKANLLYIESPGGVGFSKGQRKTYNDATTAQDNLQALLAFYAKFPNLKKNDLYITGQSYAGIYVPYLAYQIIKFNKLPTSKQKIIKLKGIMVGNACTDPKQCYQATADGNSQYFYQFLHKHAFIPDYEYQLFRGSCALGFNSQQCKKIRADLDKKFQATNSSILNIYAPCYYQSINSTYEQKPYHSQRIHKSIFTSSSSSSSQQVSHLKGDLDCQDNLGIHHFFNQPLTHTSLHVDPVHWTQCSDYVSKSYQSFANASIWIYPIMIKEGLRVWVYSGDVDADVPITGTIRWITNYREEHGLPVIQPWREWWTRGLHRHEDQVAGMVWVLKGLTFVTVKGAGHMVPKDKPQESYVMLERFLAGVSLPEKDEDDWQLANKAANKKKIEGL